MVEGFEHFVNMWKEQTKDVKIRKEFSHLLFLVVCPNKIEWDFSVEKQCQTTTFMVSGGPTGASTGHDVQFCYRKEVNNFLKNCSHTHAMIVSIGMVFDMVDTSGSETPTTSITDFYSFAESKEYIKGHIIAKKGQSAYLHHQHMNVNVDMWKTLGCPPLDEKWDKYERSDNNYHDDYTPFWLTPKDRPKIQNFTHEERRRKGFSYYRDYNEAWMYIEDVEDFVEKDDFYFSRFLTRIQESFYMFNTESLAKIPEGKFDLIFSPTAGYSAEAYVDKLNFQGEVIFYDYVQQNIDLKRTIVEMNMSKEELYIFRGYTDKNLVDNTGNLAATQRTSSMGTHEELKEMQARMRDEQEVDYWLMNIIEPDYTRLLNKIRGRNVFFDTSNIFSYHMSHAYFTVADLTDSYERLHEILGYAEKCWFQGTKPTKQWERKWISSVSE
tara:strand:+ start:993 stop:2309 length:1317 start_codon:yes stop_codon:yes gene_type:complete